jgi:hypothetical protein
MARIRSLYDALVRTQIEEDRCTNFLVWLIEKLPADMLVKICDASRLSFPKGMKDELDFMVQYPLTDSRPDAVISSKRGFLLIETKISSNAFDRAQFVNHFWGGCKEFGEDRVWLLFLSGDKRIPFELDQIMQDRQGKIGFLSWEKLLEVIRENKASMGGKYEIIIEEFLTFAKYYKLGRQVTMNNEEMAQFIEKYSELEKFKEPCTNRLLQVLDKYRDRIILECGEKVERSDDKQKKLPCLYRGFRIHGWHVDHSAYVYINILQKKIGICFVGYQNKNEKERFMALWGEKLKERYKENLSLTSLTWVEEGDDEFAINGGYFKNVEGTTGKSFNPLKIKEFEDCFYIGQVYPLDILQLDNLTDNIASDFKLLLDRFMEP